MYDLTKEEQLKELIESKYNVKIKDISISCKCYRIKCKGFISKEYECLIKINLTDEQILKEFKSQMVDNFACDLAR